MPVSIHGVTDAAAAAAGTVLTKGDNTDPAIGVIGNSYITLPNVANVMDDITVGMVVGGNNAVLLAQRLSVLIFLTESSISTML